MYTINIRFYVHSCGTNSTTVIVLNRFVRNFANALVMA